MTAQSTTKPAKRVKAKVVRAHGLTEYQGLPIIEPSIPWAIKGYRTRIVLVNGEFWCRIPQFVFREDPFCSKKRISPQWGVKREYGKAIAQKSFLDSRYGGEFTKTAALASLKAAMKYLAEQSPYVESEYRVSDEVDINPQSYFVEGAHKLIEVQPAGTIFKAYYFTITGVSGHRGLRLYIGSTRTVTQAKMLEMFGKAKRVRSKLLKLIDADYTDEVLRQMYEYARSNKSKLTYEDFVLKLKIPKH